MLVAILTAGLALGVQSESLIVDLPGRTVVLRAAELRQLPSDTARRRFHDGPTHLFAGPRLIDILRSVGVNVDSVRGRDLNQRVVLEAADGYRLVLSLGELAPGLGALTALVATTQDGQPLPAQYGPLQLIVPGDRHNARNIRQVVRLRIRADGP